MYRPGHYGAALLSYVSLGFAVTAAGREAVAVVEGTVAVTLSTTPHYDHCVPLPSHRGPTHTLAFAALVGVVLAAGVLFIATDEAPLAGPELAAFAFAVGTLSVESHFLSDWLTPMGIKSFWSVSRHDAPLRRRPSRARSRTTCCSPRASGGPSSRPRTSRRFSSVG